MKVCATMAASLEQLVCGGSDVVMAEIIAGHGIESGYGKDCDLTIPTNESCKMVKLTIKIDEVLGGRAENSDQQPNRVQVLAGQMVNVIVYVGEVLPSAAGDEDLQATSPAQNPRSDAAVVKLFAGKHFIFSFDRRDPYPPGSAQFYSAVFPLDQRAVIQQILLTGGGIPSCPRALSPPGPT
jgi:hypothetical protein